MNVNTNPAVRWSVSGAGAEGRQRTARNQDAANAGIAAASDRQDADTGVLVSLSAPQAAAATAAQYTPSDSQEEDALEQYLGSMREGANDILQKLREASEANDAAAEHWRNKILALRIAMRIANGDNVPIRDHRFLMEFDSSMYNEAVKMSVVSNNDDPENYDALTEDPDDDRAGYAADDVGKADTAAASPEPQAQAAEPVDVTV